MKNQSKILTKSKKSKKSKDTLPSKLARYVVLKPALIFIDLWSRLTIVVTVAATPVVLIPLRTLILE